MKVYLSAREFKNRSQLRRYLRELNRKRAVRQTRRMPVLTGGILPEPPRNHLDSVETQPDKQCMRVYFQNINTLKIGGEAAEDIKALKKLVAVGTAVICLSEINKNMEHGETRRAVEEVIKKARAGMGMSAGGNTFYHTSEMRKQGGVAILTKHNINKYVTRRGVDPKGRWAVLDMTVGENKLVIYNIYAPLQNEGGGPTTVS